MQAWEWWGLAALALGIAELLTGTFHLLVLGGACLGGALTAWAGGAVALQMLVTAALALLGWIGLHRWHPARRRPLEATADRDVVLDIGERVHVEAWAADGTASVVYRGARWQAERAAGAAALPGTWRIQAVSGNRLVLAPADPAPAAAAAQTPSSPVSPEQQP